MRAWALLLFCWHASFSWAQENVEVTQPDREVDSLRRQFIKSYPDHFFVYPVLKQHSLTFDIAKDDGSALLSFKPNNRFSLGLGVYLFEVAAELAFAIPLDESSKAIYGESKARDLRLNALGKAWGIDAFYQKYSGFYVAERGNEPPPGTPYPQRPDIGSRHFGVTANYVFNNRKFSFRSFYNFSERQLRSKGSFLVFSTLNHFRVSGDSSIVGGGLQDTFGANVAFSELRYTTFSAAPGYTYSIVFNNFFLNGTLSAGPAHHWIFYRLSSGVQKNEIGINSFVAARIGIGYNGDRVFGGLGFFTQGSVVNLENIRFSNNNSSFKIVMGYRFPEKGILRKRAIDQLPGL